MNTVASGKDFGNRKDRTDLSDWVVHFVHARNPANEPCDDELPEGWSPFLHLPRADLPPFSDLWEIKEEEQPLAPDADAFQVLQRILEDGHIRANWSFRRIGRTGTIKPTIYGKRPACCFTEMPLYALLQYAQDRNDGSVVATYAIGLRRKELFRAGARPVIYGLSTTHREEGGSALLPRRLSSSCGISEHEQYRYVSMNLDVSHPIDWSHEREWRWCDSPMQCDCPGLPIWLASTAVTFSEVLVVVSRDEEKDRILTQLKEMYDSGSDPYCFEYSRELIQQTHVISLEEAVPKTRTASAQIRLDDIPTHQFHAFVTPTPSDTYVNRVARVHKIASSEASKAAAGYRATAPRNADGFITDVVGYADLVTNDSQSEFVQSLLKLDLAHSLTSIGYKVQGLTTGCQDQALGEKEAAIKAAMVVFEEHFPDIYFSVRSMWD